MQKISTFYVIDFDRCLGNVDANFNLLKKIVHELSFIDEALFQSSRDNTEAKGLSFSAFNYLKESSPLADLDLIEKLFIEYALNTPEDLLEPGATKLINYFKKTSRDFCIMSCGDKRWQNTKIIAAGLGAEPRIVVSNNRKGEYLSKWFNGDNSGYTIPSNCFIDNKSKLASEIVLIDDKFIAFEGLPAASRGYLVYGSAYDVKRPHLFCPILQSVKQIENIDEIINLE